MKIETYIDSLVSYAMNTGLAEPEDHQVLRTGCWICYAWIAMSLPMNLRARIWRKFWPVF